MTIKNVEIQDSTGNIYYPHTEASIVKYGSKTVIDKLNEISNPNILINGDPQIWQRSTSLVNKQTFCADRWEYICWVGSGPSGKIEKDVDGSMKISQFNSDGNYVRQIIESLTSRTLANKKVTISADIKVSNATSGSAFIQLVFSDGVDTLDGSSTHKELIIPYNILTNNYKRFALTLDVPATTNTISFQTGSHYSNGGQLNANCVLNIKNIKLEIGEEATPFTPRLYAEELALCKRYYEETNADCLFSGAKTNTEYFIECFYEVQKRIPPTVTYGNLSGSGSQIYLFVPNNIGLRTGKRVDVDTKKVRINFDFIEGNTTYTGSSISGTGWMKMDAEIY